jgi:hypothetical protein
MQKSSCQLRDILIVFILDNITTYNRFWVSSLIVDRESELEAVIIRGRDLIDLSVSDLVINNFLQIIYFLNIQSLRTN